MSTSLSTDESEGMNPLKTLLEAELANEASDAENEQAEADATESERALLQVPTRFSESMLWDLQRQFFTEQGIDAWSNGTVPHYITSSSYMAFSYAELAIAWVDDQHRLGRNTLRILELGAGSGKFSFHFLTHCEHLWRLKHPDAARLPFTYVISDVAQSNLDFWSVHPRLRCWLEAGVLDRALFDVEADDALTLDVSGLRWRAEDEQGPLLVVANYLLDSIRQDYWHIKHEQAGLVHVVLYGPKAQEITALADVEYGFNTVVASERAYDEPSLNALLDFYRTQLEEGVVSIPHKGKACLDRMKLWCKQQLTLLVGDKGKTAWEQYAGSTMPNPTVHGSISTSVNFHALHWLVAQEEGQSWSCSAAKTGFQVAAFTWEQEPLVYFSKLCVQFEMGFGPADQFALKKGIEANLGNLSVEQLLAYLRFSCYDPKVLGRIIPHLMPLATAITKPELVQLEAAFQSVWANYYPLGEAYDLAFHMGCLLYELDSFAAAIWYFERSVELYGPDSGTLENMASCRVMMG